jgi:hypothetical protein
MPLDPTPWPQPSIIIWVSPNGSDIDGNGSDQNPYRTIERAMLDFRDGYQIRLMDGTYTPTDTILVSGLTGSIFAENDDEVTIQPQQTTEYGAAIAILNSSRFTIHGVNILQSDTTGHNYGIYAANVQNFIAYTCTVSGFDCPSGCVGIWATGTGRIENCTVSDLTIDNGDLTGIYANGLDVVDCSITALIDRGSSGVKGIHAIDDYTPPVPPTPPTPPPAPWPNCYWNFTGNFAPTDYLRLPYADASTDFHPGSGDFTAIAIFKPDLMTGNPASLINVAYDTSNNEIEWRLYYVPTGVLRSEVRKHNGIGGNTNVYTSGAMAADRLCMAAIRYHYTGDGSSDLYVHAISDAYATKTASDTTSVGPIADFGGDLCLGSMEPWTTSTSVTGKFYAAAYWNSLVDLADLEAVWDETKTIYELNPIMYVNYCKSVALTYQAEVGTGSNAPYVFSVNGNPTQG